MNRICAGCGVIAPIRRSTCAVCDAAFPNPPLRAPAGVGATRWVCVVKSQGVCATCGGRASLDGLCSSFTCSTCNGTSTLPARCWELLAQAAPVMLERWERARDSLDAGADDGIGGIGVGATTAQSTGTSPAPGAGQLDATMSFGHPLCPGCKVPYETTLDAARKLDARCGKCGEATQYSLAPAIAQAFPFAVAALAEHQRVDQPFVRVESTGDGAHAVKCPGCGAAFPVTGATHATCAYCNAVALVPRRLIQGAPPRPWWVLLPAPIVEAAPAARAARGGSVGGARVPLLVALVVGVLALGGVVAIVAASAGGSARTPGHHRH